MNAAALRDRYMNDAIATASPARLLTMLYDRLLRDVAQAEEAAAGDRPEQADALLRHAQDIVIELSASLDLQAWPEGVSLAKVYQFLLKELIAANTHKNPQRIADCVRIIEPLRETWHEVAASYATASSSHAVSA